MGNRSFIAILFSAFSIFILKAIFIGTASLRGLSLTHWIIDDAFIVMRVARNVALGHGFTYDFIHATTGAPPLWTYITALNHVLFSLEWAVKSTIIEMAFFGALSTILVFLIAQKISGKEEAGWLAFLLASFSGAAFFQAMNGMETSMFTFGVLLTITLWLGIGKPTKIQDWQWNVLIGSAAGLTSMIRGDGLFILLAILITEVCMWFYSSVADRKVRLRRIVVIGSTWGIFFSLLLSWQVLRTGSIFLGNQIGRHELALALHGFSFEHFVFMPYIKIVVWNIFQLLKLLSIALGTWFLLPLVFCLSRKSSSTQKLSHFTIVYASLFLGTLVFYQWYFPDLHGLRYLNPLIHIVFALMGSFLVTELAVITRWLKYLIVGMLIVVSQYLFYDLCVHMSWAKDMSFFARTSAKQEEQLWSVITWAKTHIPPGSVVASRDHGRFALFTDRPVQDIAGIMDPIVPTLVRTGGLREYLKSRNVTYAFVPSPETRGDLLYKILFKELHLVSIPGAPTYGTAGLYKVQW